MTRNRNLLFHALTVSLSLALVSATAFTGEGCLKTAFEAIEVPVAVDNPGIMSFPDGNIHVRGHVSTVQWIATDARLSLNTVVVMNGNYDAMGNGPIWGTFESVGDDSTGGWVGVWHGQITDLSQYQLMHSGVGHGTGAFEGLKLKYACTYNGMGPGVCEGVILETKEK